MTRLNRIIAKGIMDLPLMLIPSLISIWIITQYTLSDWEYSLLICTNFIYLLARIWYVSKKQITPMLLFFVTFSFLFIGGRFWGILLGSEQPLWVGTFFYEDYLNIERRTNLLIYLLAFIYSMIMGYVVCYKSYIYNKRDFNQIEIREKINYILGVIFWVIAPFILYRSVHQFLLAFRGGGYLSLYFDAQNSDYSSGLFQTIISVLFGYAMVFGDRNVKRNYIFLFFISAIIMLLIGGRGAFGSIMLFSLWLYSQYHKVNLQRLAMYGFVALCLLLFIFQYSIRNADSTININVFELLSAFFYSQGVSLFVFECSTWFSYPYIPYIQVFIPGSAMAYSLISGIDLQMSDVSFADSLANQLNPQLYYQGYGLGWTLMSDVYVFSGGFLVLFILLSSVLGFLLGWIECKSKESSICKVIIFVIFLKLMILPRGAIVSVSILSIYSFLFYILFIAYCRKKFNNLTYSL